MLAEKIPNTLTGGDMEFLASSHKAVRTAYMEDNDGEEPTEEEVLTHMLLSLLVFVKSELKDMSTENKALRKKVEKLKQKSGKMVM